MADFIFINDPGHGWLLVGIDDLAAVGLTEADITPYSYRERDTLALEEDCDASTFLNAWTVKHGRAPKIGERSGTARNWRPFGTRDYNIPRPDLEAAHKAALAYRNAA